MTIYLRCNKLHIFRGLTYKKPDEKNIKGKGIYYGKVA
jgi:hypothetical protein